MVNGTSIARIRRVGVASLALLVLSLPGMAAGSKPATPANAGATSLTGVDGPLRVGPTRRYLVDRRGTPVLLVGDSPQALVTNVSPREMQRFLEARRKAGFNAVWVNLLCNAYTGGRRDGTTYDGIRPFRVPGDLATPNEAYFRRVDRLVAVAAKLGLTVLLDPIETGGWLGILRKNGVKKNAAYGRFLGTRYRAYPNIVWLHGDDFYRWPDPFWDSLVLAVARGIRARDTNHLHTVQLSENPSLVDPRWAPLIGLDATYTYSPTYAQVLMEYNRRPRYLPVFLAESNYESERGATAGTLRRQHYWTMLSGATGLLYGNHFVWQFIDGWKRNMNTPGVAQLRYMTQLLRSHPWFKLVPDQDHEVVIEGYGRFSATGRMDANDYATTARTPDGSLAISYLPTSRTVTVDLAAMSGSVEARWFDPTSGRYTSVTGGPMPNVGTRMFTPPGPNSDGDGDWVLVLTSP